LLLIELIAIKLIFVSCEQIKTAFDRLNDDAFVLVACEPYTNAEAKSDAKRTKKKGSSKQNRPDGTKEPNSQEYNAVYVFVHVGCLKINLFMLLELPKSHRSFLVDATYKVRALIKIIDLIQIIAIN
jgi:hypothetical protein